MDAEFSYVPPPVYRSDWEELRASGQLSARNRRPAKWVPVAPRSSLDHLALIDEALSSHSVNYTSAKGYSTLKTLAETANTPDRWKRARSIYQCGSTMMLFARRLDSARAPDTDRDGGCLAPKRCHCRACPACQHRRRIRLRSLFEQRWKAMHRPKMLTLTLASSPKPLADQCHRIKESFRRLRARALWKQQVHGGFWVIEITRNERTQLWHVHIHAIIDSTYLPQDWLSREWKAITGDSYVIDIRQAPLRRARYLSKYVTKGSSVSSNGGELWQYYEALHRSRDTNTFGETTPNPKPEPQFVFLGTVRSIIGLARQGDEAALDLLAFMEQCLVRRIRDI